MELTPILPWIAQFAGGIVTLAGGGFALYKYAQTVALRRLEFVRSIYRRFDEAAIAELLFEAEIGEVNVENVANQRAFWSIIGEIDLVAMALSRKLISRSEIQYIAYELELVAVAAEAFESKLPKRPSFDLPPEAQPLSSLHRLRRLSNSTPG